MNLTRLLSKRLALLIAPALIAPVATTGCGKEDNIHDVVLLDFPHSFPEMPRQLSVAADAMPMNHTGHPLAATDEHIFLLDRDNRELVRLDRHAVDKNTRAQTTPGAARQLAVKLGGRPEQLVITPTGDLLVTLRTTGEVLRITPDLVIAQRERLGVEAHGIALSQDGRTAYVTLPRNAELVTLDSATFEELDRATVLDTPRGVTVSSNGYALVVHQHGPAVRVSLDDNGMPLGSISDLNLRRGNPTAMMMGGRLDIVSGTRALAVATSPENGAAYVAHVTASPGSPDDFANQVVNGGDASGSTDGYGSSSLPSGSFNVPSRPVEVAVTVTDPSATVIGLEVDFPVQDPKTGEPMAHLLDQPSDIAHHPTWSLLFMTGYGTDNVLVMSTSEGDPMRSTLALVDVGRAPRGINFSPDGKTAYVLNEHDLSVTPIDLTPFFELTPMNNGSTVFPDTDVATVDTRGMFMDPGTGQMEVFGSDPTPDSARAAPFRHNARPAVTYAMDPMPEAIRRGARVFTHARNEKISHAGQFACASCHFEGTEDKLVWVITDGPRQTPSLAGRLKGTAPFNWAGTEEVLAGNMVQTVDRMGGEGLSAQDLADLEQFLLFGLEAPPNPYVAADGALTADQLAGKAIFESKDAACSTCHIPERDFVDGKSHDVGTASQNEVVSYQFQFAMNPEARPPWILDTPTLKGVYYTAPYFHDGSAPTLYDVLEREGSRMGSTAHLTQAQKQQLVAYLLTL